MKTEEIKGFIQLNREAIIQTPWFMNGDLERLGAWISLLLFVNHKRNKISIQGEEIDLEKGQLARSITGLAKDWNKNRKWVRNFLNECKALGYLDYEECAPKGWSLTTKITIKQYDRFLRGKNGDTQYEKNRDTQQRPNYQESLDDKKHNGDTSKTVPKNTDNNTPIKITNISNNNINSKENILFSNILEWLGQVQICSFEDKNTIKEAINKYGFFKIQNIFKKYKIKYPSCELYYPYFSNLRPRIEFFDEINNLGNNTSLIDSILEGVIS